MKMLSAEAMHISEERQVFPGREGGVQGNILGYDSNDFLDFIQVGADIQSIDLNTSFCSPEQSA